MGALIDSSVLIAAERGALDLDELVASYEGDVALSVITATELLHGVHRAGNEAARARRSAYVEATLDSMPVVAFDLVAARLHAHLSASLAEAGQAIGAHDLIIAATALSRGLDVLARDERSFPRVPGLTVSLC